RGPAGGTGPRAARAVEGPGVLRSANRLTDVEPALREGIDASRHMGERILLPRLLSQLAEVQLSLGQREQAADALHEADDLMEGLLTNASSPWVRGRILASMNDVVAARIRLEGERNGRNPAPL